MTPPDDDDELAVQPAFEELAQLSFAEHSLESVLGRVTELATRILPGRPVASVTILGDGSPRTVAASGDLALKLDEVQYGLGGGPCLEAATTGRPAVVADTRSEPRWPAFGTQAAALGCGSILSYPLPVQERVSGSMNVYAGDLTVADDRTRALVSRLAAYAVGPVSNMYLYETAVERAEHLAAALEHRAVIDQAKGILMERHKLTADQAFRLLARVSMESNTKLRDVAARFVLTGQLRPD
ncbi:GAF and ANTAR domain-containing protein [Blastococcus sp. MG754426]|uniref:GAF and ANTAR domain-containing protein n=1 Tax=unclassified Blastococcus TaxID=2619396 RepID=UPI001EF131A7|nr:MULTISPECIES: GAF and ANTAR domain-containing protein [unclassified Blastococcus]MCF6508962.1 GAF and ANTAR domain-containing protein [Blastococcus sp. MG754426]MCF6513669.1 GAF and ANTAR domain-containing protein [Blastococcus sp. MG754427]